MAEEDIAFVVHLGDYVYEYEVDANGGVRNVPVTDQLRPECVTLERYRSSTRSTRATPISSARTSSSPG